MFSVYGKAGRVFRGSMEELRKIGPTAAISRSQRVQAVARGANEVAPRGVGAEGGHARDPAHREALAAYAQTLHLQPPRHPLTRVRDIMNPGAISLSEDATVGRAWELLAQHQLGQAPVVDGDNHLVGLLTRGDLMRADRIPGPHTHALAWQAWLAQTVQQVMWTPVPSVAPETDIRHLARVLLDTGLPGLPVVNEGDVVMGFVSRSDILRAVVADPPLDLWS